MRVFISNMPGRHMRSAFFPVFTTTDELGVGGKRRDDVVWQLQPRVGRVNLAIVQPYLPSMCEIIAVFGIQGHLAWAKLTFLFIRGKCFGNLFKKDSRVSLGMK